MVVHILESSERPLLELSYQPKNFLSLLWQWQGATVVAIQKDKKGRN